MGSKPGPGVFVFGFHDDPKQRHYLNLYKLGEGPLYSFYTPYSPVPFRGAALRSRRAVLLDDPWLASPDGSGWRSLPPGPKTDLKVGQVLDGFGGFLTYLERLRTRPLPRSKGFLPMGVSEGCVMARNVPKDATLTYADVILPQDRLIDQLRAEQAAMFGG